MSHFLHECVHGFVVAQCRCPGPRGTFVVPCPDPDTEAHAAAVKARAEDNAAMQRMGIDPEDF